VRKPARGRPPRFGNSETMPALRIMTLCGLFLVSPAGLADPVAVGIDAETRLKHWEWNADGVALRITQRLPDQTRAFFLARGFNQADADYIAGNCIFQTMFRNTGPETSGTVASDLKEWHIRSNGKDSQLLVREHWRKLWAEREIPQSAGIAFEWSLLPTQQTYAPGDYNWGMTSYGLPPDRHFDLVFTWHRNGQRLEGKIGDIQCAPDIHPEPSPAND
jgi:hypothetical protein